MGIPHTCCLNMMCMTREIHRTQDVDEREAYRIWVHHRFFIFRLWHKRKFSLTEGGISNFSASSKDQQFSRNFHPVSTSLPPPPPPSRELKIDNSLTLMRRIKIAITSLSSSNDPRIWTYSGSPLIRDSFFSNQAVRFVINEKKLKGEAG